MFTVKFIVSFMQGYTVVVNDSTNVDDVVYMLCSLSLIKFIFVGSNHYLSPSLISPLHQFYI